MSTRTARSASELLVRVREVFLNPESAKLTRTVSNRVKSEFEKKKKSHHVRRCAIFRPKSSEKQKKNFTPRKFCALRSSSSSPLGYAPEHVKNNWAFASQNRPSSATGYYKAFVSLYCQHARVKKSNRPIPGVTKQGYGKVANFKMV